MHNETARRTLLTRALAPRGWGQSATPITGWMNTVSPVSARTMGLVLIGTLAKLQQTHRIVSLLRNPVKCSPPIVLTIMDTSEKCKPTLMARALASTKAEAEKQILTTAKAKSHLWGTLCNLEVEYKEKKRARATKRKRHWDRKRGRREEDKRVTRLRQTKQEKIPRESPQNGDTALITNTDPTNTRFDCARLLYWCSFR